MSSNNVELIIEREPLIGYAGESVHKNEFTEFTGIKIHSRIVCIVFKSIQKHSVIFSKILKDSFSRLSESINSHINLISYDSEENINLGRLIDSEDASSSLRELIRNYCKKLNGEDFQYGKSGQFNWINNLKTMNIYYIISDSLVPAKDIVSEQENLRFLTFLLNKYHCEDSDCDAEPNYIIVSRYKQDFKKLDSILQMGQNLSTYYLYEDSEKNLYDGNGRLKEFLLKRI